MKLALIFSIVTSITNATAAESNSQNSSEQHITESKYNLITPNATPETQELYQKLASIQGKNMLFGHHLSNVMGVGYTDWKQKLNSSDVVKSVSDYPALFGFDFGRGFSRQMAAVKTAAKLGGIITISDHMPNPHKPKTYKHIKGSENELKAALPGGEYHDVLLARLDSVADFANKAIIDGKKIPIIYRPWHEHTGGWFWWGSKSSTPEEYIQLWRFTVEYLRDIKGVNNLIYAYSPSQFNDDYSSYEYRNPGSEYFDIAGIDIYTTSGDENVTNMINCIASVVEYAQTHNKVPALTEFGYRSGIENCEDPNWYTEAFLNPLLANKKAREIVYALTWTNSNTGTWVPLEGNPMHNDFIKFYEDNYTAFLKDWLNR